MAKRARLAGLSGALACSIVSSSALQKVAEYFAMDYIETLTGFKWISKVPKLIFGYEEALGYCVDPQRTPDKDGVSAALLIASIASDLAKQGRTITDQLAELGELYGHFATGQISIRVTDLSEIARLMQNLRSQTPELIDGVTATFTDLKMGANGLAPTDGLRFDLADGRRVIVRPSGTEPKLKCYLQAIGESRELAEQKLQALRDAMQQLLK
jgi:phosphomannomutase